MRRVVIALSSVGVMGAAAFLCAQQVAPVFRSSVTLVTLDVQVLDHDGKPLPGLSADDFEVKLDGHVQPVRVLAFLQPVAAPAASAAPDVAAEALLLQSVPTHRRTTTNAAPAGESRVFVIFVDDLSLAPGRGKAMVAAALRFIDRLPASDLVGFATSSGTGMVNPTTSRAAVRSALSSASGQFSDPRAMIAKDGPVVGISESLDVDYGGSTGLKAIIDRECFGGQATVSNLADPALQNNPCVPEVETQVRRTAALTKTMIARQLDAYLAVIRAMGTARGIKHLVVLSDGVAIPRNPVDFVPVARAAAEAGVQLSMLLEEPDKSLVDSSLLSSGATMPTGRDTIKITTSGTMGTLRRVDDRMFMDGAQRITDLAGGDFYRIIGDAEPFFLRMAAASSAVYRLGVEAPSNTTPGRDFEVVATVKRPNLTVRTNQIAVAAQPLDALPVDEQLQAAMAGAAPRYQVPIRLAAALRRSADGVHLDLGVNLAIPSSAKGPLTTMLGLVDAAGVVRSGRKMADAPADGADYSLAFNFPVTPGTYRLRVAAADAAGNVGSLESVVVAKLATIGPFTASDLVTSWIGADGKPQFLAVDELPSGVEMLHALLELYPAAGAAPPDDVHVLLVLIPAGQDQPTIEREVVPDGGGGVLRAEGRFPVDQMPKGLSTIRATVLVGGHAVGTVSAVIRIK